MAKGSRGKVRCVPRAQGNNDGRHLLGPQGGPSTGHTASRIRLREPDTIMPIFQMGNSPDSFSALPRQPESQGRTPGLWLLAMSLDLVRTPGPWAVLRPPWGKPTQGRPHKQSSSDPGLPSSGAEHHQQRQADSSWSRSIPSDLRI